MVTKIAWFPWEVLVPVVELSLFSRIGVQNGAITRQIEIQKWILANWCAVKTIVRPYSSRWNRQWICITREGEFRTGNSGAQCRDGRQPYSEMVGVHHYLDSCDGQLLMLDEAYPDLRAAEDFKARKNNWFCRKQDRTSPTVLWQRGGQLQSSSALFSSHIMAKLFRFSEYRFLQVEGARSQQVSEVPELRF